MQPLVTQTVPLRTPQVEFERQRQINASRRLKICPVGKQSRNIRQPKPAVAHDLGIDAQTAHAPGERHQRARRGADRVLRPTVSLLEMLDTQKHALSPNNSVVMCHGCSAGSVQRFEIVTEDLPARTSKLVASSMSVCARHCALSISR